MKITDDSLKKFRQWLLDRGRSENTADTYCSNLRQCAKDTSMTTRLVASDLAPLSKRTNKAAIVQWAKFTKQPDLADIVKEIKLPPARRRGIKLPLAHEDWKRMVESLATVKHAPTRCACTIIAKRGLRVSDALGIRRSEVMDALRTGKLSYEGKGRKRHVVSAAPVRDVLVELSEMKGWDRLGALVGPGKHRASSANKIRRAFVRCAKRLEVDDVYPHRFRRTYATTFLKALAGDPQALIKLQNHMGWSNLQTAAAYADAVDADELSRVGDEMAEKIFR